MSDAYRDDNEVVRNASGGRALCGIYFSEHTSPITPELPVLAMPRKLHLSSPNNSQQVRYIKFSEAKAAANYVQTVKSTSSNIGLSIGGFQELFHEGAMDIILPQTGKVQLPLGRKLYYHALYSILNFHWLIYLQRTACNNSLSMRICLKKVAQLQITL